MVYGMAWMARHDIWYGLAAMACYMLWPDGHHMVYGMAWRTWHGIWYVERHSITGFKALSWAKVPFTHGVADVS